MNEQIRIFGGEIYTKNQRECLIMKNLKLNIVSEINFTGWASEWTGHSRGKTTGRQADKLSNSSTERKKK